MSSDSVIISSVAFPEPTSLALVADVQFHEPYVSAGLNRKLRGILKEGFYSGFLPRPAGGLKLLITSVSGEDKTGSASVNIGDEYQITIRQQKDVTLQLSAGTKFAIVLKGIYTLGSDTYQVNSKSNIQAAEISAKTFTDSYALGEGELLICTVDVPAGATELTDNMIDITDKKVATIGIELSNDFQSQEEDKAATPKAVSDGIAEHERKPNPHAQYLMTDNCLYEIAMGGEEAINQVFFNLGLGDAAKRNVGTSFNELPDMSSFDHSIGGNGYMCLPGGLIIQWGRIQVDNSIVHDSYTVPGGSVNKYSGSVNYPIDFPGQVNCVLAMCADGLNVHIASVYPSATSRFDWTLQSTRAYSTATSGFSDMFWIAIGI